MLLTIKNKQTSKDLITETAESLNTNKDVYIEFLTPILTRDP